MDKIPFIGGAYVARSLNVDAQRCINLYPEVDESGAGKNVVSLYGTPGLRLFCTLPGPNANRPGGMYVTSTGRWFNVIGNRVFELFSDASFNLLGTISTFTGPVSISDNGATASIGGDQLIIVDGNGYILNLGTDAFSPIVGFPGGSTVAFLNEFFFVNEPNSRRIFQSDILDGTTWDAQAFEVASGGSDPAVCVKSNGQYLFVFGTKFYRAWYNAGTAPFVLASVLGSLHEIGCASRASVVNINGDMFWLGEGSNGRGVVFKTNGFAPERISTHAIEFYLSDLTDLTNAVGWNYEDQGHYFYCLTLQSANKTLCYDITTKLWHERAYLDTSTGNFTRHRGISCVFFKGKNYVADYQNGNIYELTDDVHTDNGNPLKWLRSSPHIAGEERRIICDRFQVLIQSGVGTSTGQGYDPQAQLRVSKDYGNTFGPMIPASMGKMGEYKARAVWNRLGMARDFVFEVSGSDPVKTVLVDALAKTRVGDD